MLLAVDFYQLPYVYDGLKFEFDYASIRGIPGRLAEKLSGQEFKIRTTHALSMNALVAGHTIVESPDGGIASVLSQKLPVLVDVYAEHMGIFVGGVCVASASDLSDDDGRWHFWKYNAGELFRQALDLCP